MTGTLQNKRKDRKAQIRRCEPIIEDGLTFYPITMDYYDEFISCKKAIILRQGSLPVRFLSMDYLSALFAMEIESIRSKGKSMQLFLKAMTMLHLSLRIGLNVDELYKNMLVEINKDQIVLKQIVIKQNEKIVKFTPLDFSNKFRKIIAEQNGLELPDETENVDLVRDNEKLKEMRKGKPLNIDLNDLIASVAYQSKITEKEIMNWTIREFENRIKAIDRDKRYTMYGQAEMSGMVSFKDGNPAPSWQYDVLDNSLGTVEGSKLQNTLSGVAQEKK